MGEKETMTGAAARLAGPTEGGPAGMAIGDQGTTEPQHGGGGGGGGGTSHGPLFPQGGELPTHPGTAPGEEPPEGPGAETPIIKSKSNITNN